MRHALMTGREISQPLRQTVLPEPECGTDLNGMRVAARYHAADQAVGVGGDWYLSDPLPCGDLLLAVGDVVGHGLAAAGPMVQLRHAMAALAAAGHGPGEILTALNGLLCRQRAGTMATAVVATYRPLDRKLTWARAGHPPILRANRDGVEPLWEPAGAILGAFPDVGYTHTAGRLAADELLVMYTDGYVEEPGRDVDDGLRQLGDHASSVMRGPATDGPTAVVDRLRRRNPRDDACVLAAAPLG